MRFPDTPVVLLHAFPLDSRMWDDVRPGIDGLVTPDQRGFGAAPLGDASPDLEVAAADVISLLDGQRVVLGGCSMGGYVAMAVLRAAPSLVAGLVLVDTRAAADAPSARENRLAAADRADAEGVDWIPSAMLPALLGPGAGPSVVARTRALITAQNPAAVAWAQRAMAARPDSSDLLRSTSVPTLIVRGAEDELIPRAEAESLASLLPEAEVVELSGAGHLPPLETPVEFTSALRAWLAG
jgi:pimeloyl-ACP methyl ester carboxylesterase